MIKVLSYMWERKIFHLDISQKYAIWKTDTFLLKVLKTKHFFLKLKLFFYFSGTSSLSSGKNSSS